MSDWDEQFWLAYRYVSGELTATEREAFEQRLETDLAACEAVALATELLDSLAAIRHAEAAAPQLRGPVVSSGWLQGVMGAALATAVCLMGVLLGSGLWRAGNNNDGATAPRAEAPARDVEDLATIWSQTRHGLDSPWLAAEEVDTDPSGESWLGGEGAVEEDSAWIQAALVGLAADQGQDEPVVEGTL